MKTHTLPHVPIALIFLRLTIGLGIMMLSLMHVGHYKRIAIPLLTVGLLTDIFDGIIARRLDVSTRRLRRLDSNIDQVFFISVVVATYIQCPDFFKLHSFRLILLFALEGLAYLVSWLKFRKEVATHSLGAKAWSVLLFATLVEIMTHCQSVILFEFCFWVGVITRLEIITIILILTKWTNDVPTFYHALKLSQGKEIKRNKFFN